VEGDNQGQPAPGSSEAPAAGTTDSSVTDAAVSTEATTEAATPDSGTSDSPSETSGSAEETPTERQSRRERQREARKQAAATPPPPEPVKSREQIIAEHEAQQRAAHEAQQKRQAEQQRYAKYIGEDPVNPNDPQSPTRYQQLLSEANTPIPDGDDQFYTEESRALAQRVNRARQQLQELNERRGLLQEVYTPAQQAAQLQARDWLGNELERGIAELGLNVPEVLSSVQGIKDPNALIPQIVKTMGEKIKAAAVAPLNEKIEDLEDDLAAKDSEIDALRRQLGGAAPQALRGGSVAAGTSIYTRERLSQMLRTPEGIKEYRRNQSEISRQEAAGLIR
jgi:hypothetical protein